MNSNLKPGNRLSHLFCQRFFCSKPSDGFYLRLSYAMLKPG
ncbi:hypothetical protein EJP617_16340 [Erwinia sp. Ejp617]|nr:hypothetical protein EJP617_16340 [Erwinia sp. Ejp617]